MFTGVSEITRATLPIVPAAGLVLLLAARGVAATPEAARDSITADDLRRHIEFLASDTLEGRAAGTQGGRAAAAYLAQQFRKAGLQPGAEEGDFLQPFDNGYQNLLAVVPGSDPDLAEEVLIVSGHFDHVGYGNRSNSFGPFGQIHNGADDNASGTAAVLAVARAIASLNNGPRRTVLFALWDAEEGGLLGAKHWLSEPTVAPENVRLMINCDMVGRLRNDVLVTYGIRTAPGLRRRVAESNVRSDLTFNFDWRQRDDSDHWPFYRRGLPYLLLHTGDHLDYHRPSDDVDKINFDGLERLSQFLFQLTRDLADAKQLPGFRPQSREERRWHQQQFEKPGPPPLPRLGLNWSSDRVPGEAFVVTKVDGGSPAAAAGIRVGDRIIRFAGQSTVDARELVDLVLVAPEKTTVEVVREGSVDAVRLDITLRGRPLRIGVSWRVDDAEPGVAIVTTVSPGSPAARAGIEPLDRLLPPVGQEPDDLQWLVDLAQHEKITLRRERRGRLSELTLRPLPRLEQSTPVPDP